MIFYRYSIIVGKSKKKCGHLDLLFRRIEKLGLFPSNYDIDKAKELYKKMNFLRDFYEHFLIKHMEKI